MPISGQTTFPKFSHSLTPVTANESHNANLVVSGAPSPSSGTYNPLAFMASLPTVFRAWIASGALGNISGISHSVAGQLRITSGQLSGIAQVQREIAMRVAYMDEVERNGRDPNEDGAYLAAQTGVILTTGNEIRGY